MFGLVWFVSCIEAATTKGDEEMKHISKCLPAELMAELDRMRAATRGSYESASGRSAAVKGGDQFCAGEDGEPVAFARGGVAQTEFGKRTGANPGQVNRDRKALTDATILPFMPRIGMEMTVASRRVDEPQSPAAVISMAMWKLAHASAFSGAR